MYKQLSLASLGLSYIAAGLDVSARDTQFIKYHTAKSMGFEATLAPTGLEGETGVIMRSLELNIDAGARFGCLFDLKRVLDCARPLNRRDIVQQEGVPDSATPLVGLDFADLVLRLFSADLSLPSLPPLHLRALLDCLRIVVFKHDITSRPDLSELLVAALKRTVELIVADDIAHEIRLVVISVLLCALRRYPSLVIPLLGQQISCCLAMMAKQLDDRGAEFSQARTFLQAAFAKYGASGLFVLVFKVFSPYSCP